MKVVNIINEALASLDYDGDVHSVDIYDSLDSLDRVNLVLALEEILERETDKKIIVDGRREHFQTIYHLERYIGDLLTRSQAVKKLVIVDLDDTLWRGIIGDCGSENIEPNIDLQIKLRDLSQRGILLAICSKNNEGEAKKGLQHRGSKLHIDDFVAWRINWQSKAGNIREILDELNLGDECFVFVDDSPTERAEVENFFPESVVVHPDDFDESMFDVENVTREDMERLQMYRTEKLRREVNADSLEEWAEKLGVRIEVSDYKPEYRERVLQLLNKANQMNLQTHRYDGDEFDYYVNGSGLQWRVAHVSDRFGDYGLTGIISINGNLVHDFVVSCRVFNRGVEDALLESFGKDLIAEYKPTVKNGKCKDYFEKFDRVKDNVFNCSLAALRPHSAKCR